MFRYLLLALLTVTSIASLSSALTADVTTSLKASTSDDTEVIWADPTYGTWHSCVMGGGGNLIDLVPCPSKPTRMYCYGDMDGLFRTDNSGQSWRMIHGTMPVNGGTYEFAGIVVNPKDPDHIAVARGGESGPSQGVYTTADGGKTWQKTLNARFMGNGPLSYAGPRIGGSCAKNGVVIAASEGTGVWRSSDGGRTWADCGLHGIYFTDVMFDRSNSKRIWLCAEPVNVGASSELDKLDGGLYRSDNSGVTWEHIGVRSPFEVIQDPVQTSTLIGLWDNGIERSVDGGVSWTEFAIGLPTKKDIATGESPFYAVGTGPNFTVVVQTMPTVIYRLEGGQSEWHKIMPNFSKTGWRIPFTSPPAGHSSSIVISPTNPNHWYLLDEWGLYQTFDSGQNWTPTNHGVETTVTHTLLQDPSDPDCIYLGAGDVGFWRSDNSGTVFTQTNSSLAGWVGNVKCIDSSRSNPPLVYFVGGEGWRSDRVYVSTDSGRTVTLLPRHNSGLPLSSYCCDSIVVDPKDSMSVYLTTSATVDSSSGGVYHSVDGGYTWSWLSNGLPIGKQVFDDNIWWGGRELAIGNDGVMLAISANCNGIYRWDAAHSRWQNLSLQHTGGMYSVVADPLTSGRFYVCIIGDDTTASDVDGGLFRTDDNGNTWTKIISGSVHSVTIDCKVAGRVACSTRNGVMLSLDGGNSWRLLPGMPNGWFDECLAFTGNRLVAGTGGNGAFWTDFTLQKK